MKPVRCLKSMTSIYRLVFYSHILSLALEKAAQAFYICSYLCILSVQVLSVSEVQQCSWLPWHLQEDKEEELCQQEEEAVPGG